MLRSNDIIALLGAGCSFKAGIPTSDKMLQEVHQLLRTKDDWKKYTDLYGCIRGLILSSDAYQCKFDEYFNIERLVSSLLEIEHRQKNVLNPFIETFNSRLITLSGDDLSLITDFRRKIVERLKSWVQLKSYAKADYYRYFFDFAEDYNQSLRIFTLNYDMCLEKNKPDGKIIERGFDEHERIWDWKRFDNPSGTPPSIFYYKMHGSIDWERDKSGGNILREIESIPDDPDLIFGTVNKLYPNDPYLFYAYEFRKYTLQSKIILIIGYSFSDDHINRILRQAIQADKERRMLVVMPHPNQDQLLSALDLKDHKAQIHLHHGYAEDFLKDLTINKLLDVAGIPRTIFTDPFA